jgi:hypothetical protein
MIKKSILENLKGRDCAECLGHRWEGNIRMNLREMGWKDVDWMYLVQDRDHWWDPLSMIMNFQVP